MKFVQMAIAGFSVLTLAGPSALAQGSIPMDQPVTVGSVDAVCTGIGSDAQQDPRWLAYPVRIEFSNGAAQYLSGAHVELTNSKGKPLAALDCDAPWVLFKLGRGTYRVSATLTGQQGGGTSSATFSPPAKGQKRVVLGFHLQPNQ